MSSQRRTYWHFEGQGRLPSEYDITSARLLYHREHGFSVDTPVARWHRSMWESPSLRGSDWESFKDPLETTYTDYVTRQAERESFVDGLFRSIEGTDHDGRMAREWLELLASSLPVLRFPCHGLQMLAAQVAQWAPTGRIAMLGLFQAADEMRRVQLLAYRMRQLQDIDPNFGSDSKQQWQSNAVWQPLRRVIELLLRTHDFGESFVALNLLLKPAFDRVFLHGLAEAAEAHGDTLFDKLLFSLGEDAAWHHGWARALLDHTLRSDSSNQAAIAGWVEHWTPEVEAALASAAQLIHVHHSVPNSVEQALRDLNSSKFLHDAHGAST
ncbi:MAG TPA: hypothetical protein VI197_10490 [Polyangiaceae bacterium]